MNINKIGDKLLASYLLLSSCVSLLFLVILVFGSELTIGLLIAVTLSFILLAILVVYNGKILIKYSQSKGRFFVNSLAASFQVPFLYTDGFQYKYNQGIQLVVYGKIFNGTSDFRFGLDFQKYSYLINIQFRDFVYTSMGIDVLALLILIFYVHRYNELK